MSGQYDLIVVGSGSAGTNIALACRAAGWSVAVVDSRPFGGTCALRGCDPKRVLIGAAEAVDASERMRALGVVRGSVNIDWPALMRFKRTFTEPMTEEREKSFADAGIACVHGRARFIDAKALRVGDDELTARHFAIAAGARRRTLGIPGEELLTTSTQLMDVDELPKRIVFVGGGYISFEFAHLCARAGAQVEIVHAGQRALEGFDADLSERLVNLSREIGIGVHLNAPVVAVEKRDGDLLVRVKGDNAEQTFAADIAVHGAGRVPEIDDLDLERAGVARTKHGVSVNAYLQSTTNPAVYAAGDAADGGGLPLTPVASLEGSIVAENLLNGNRHSADFSGLVTIVFTIPPLASVGLQEAQAQAQGLRFTATLSDTTQWFSSRRIGSRSSAIKMLVEDETQRILGASILGEYAEELANLLAPAVRSGATASSIRDVLFGYPTAASDLEYTLPPPS